MSENKSVFNWTLCQLLTEKPNYTKNIWHSAQQLKIMLPLMGREIFNVFMLHWIEKRRKDRFKLERLC
jgi:hypothetical protein